MSVSDKYVVKVSYLSIWIDSRPIVWDSSVVFNDKLMKVNNEQINMSKFCRKQKIFKKV